MNNSVIKLIVFFLTGIGMAAIPVVLSFLLWRNKSKKPLVDHKLSPTSSALDPYESGMPPAGSGRAVGFEFFMYAVLFLLFDVIAVLLFLGVIAMHINKALFFLPFLVSTVLAALIVIWGAKKRQHLSI